MTPMDEEYQEWASVETQELFKFLEERYPDDPRFQQTIDNVMGGGIAIQQFKEGFIVDNPSKCARDCLAKYLPYRFKGHLPLVHWEQVADRLLQKFTMEYISTEIE